MHLLTGVDLSYTYDYRLVALSVFIAICSSYTALDLGERTTAANGKTRGAWLTGGAVAMGLGIWAMHYIGMLAFRLPIPVRYDLPTVVVSLVAGIASSFVALYVVSRPKLGAVSLCVGGLLMGAGIATMHYTGMAAMRLPAKCHYDGGIVALSIAIAVVVSMAALWITFRLRSDRNGKQWLKIASAAVMGVAVAGMHYTGMAAACFRNAPAVMNGPGATDAAWVGVTGLGVAGIAIVTILILALTLAGALADRRFSAQAQTLDSSQRSYQLLFTRSLAGVYRASPSGDLLDLNQACMAMLGYDNREEALSANIKHHFLSIEEEREFFSRLNDEQKLSGYEACLRGKDGSQIWSLQSATLIQGEKSQPPSILATMFDISEQKRTEQALSAAMRAAEEASQAKSQFLANMSHEIRTPMNGILGMTELALDTPLDSEQREYMENVRDSAESLLTIINDILDFSRIEANRLELDIAAFSLSDVTRQSIRFLGGKAEAKGLKVSEEIDQDIPANLLGDVGRLRQVLTNLLANAIKFTERGSVDIRARLVRREKCEALIHIMVRDTGIGIPEDMQSVIFEAFSQVDGSNQRRHGGTGLGLAISAQLIKAMNGRIWVQSAPLVGSTFHVELPLALA